MPIILYYRDSIFRIFREKTCTNLVDMFYIIPINLRFIKFVSNIVKISCKFFQNDLDSKRVREYKVV